VTIPPRCIDGRVRGCFPSGCGGLCAGEDVVADDDGVGHGAEDFGVVALRIMALPQLQREEVRRRPRKSRWKIKRGRDEATCWKIFVLGHMEHNIIDEKEGRAREEEPTSSHNDNRRKMARLVVLPLRPRSCRLEASVGKDPTRFETVV